jgi:hypothetical protein
VTSPVSPFTASDHTILFGLAGALSIGGSAGVGAGVDVADITKNTTAYVMHGADIDADKDVFIEAASEEDITSISAALAAGGSAGVGGSTGVHILHPTTLAYIEGDPLPANRAHVDAGGSVVVSAWGDTDFTIFSGNLTAGGTASVGAAVGITVIYEVDRSDHRSECGS